MGDLISGKHARRRAPDKRGGSGAGRLGPFALAIPLFLISIALLTPALTFVDLLGIQLNLVGQRVLSFLAMATGLSTTFVALHEFVKMKGGTWRPRKKFLIVGSVVAVSVALIASLAFFNDPYLNLRRMSGTQDIATLPFVHPDGSRTQAFKDLATGLAENLADKLPANTVEPYLEVDAPLHQLAESKNSGIDDWTADFAVRSGADLIFSGVIDDQSDSQIRIRPAIYISPVLVPEAMELSGWVLGPWMPAVGGLDSSRGRESILRAFLHDGLSLVHFVDALDAWRVGDVALADRLLRAIPIDDNQGLIPVDMLYLFRGHARQLVALNTGASDGRRSKLLASAAADYQRISASSSSAVRARLSLAGNEYLRSSGRLCSRKKADRHGLEHAAKELNLIAGLSEIRPTVRIAALINFAQTQACLRRAHWSGDEAKISSVLAEIRAFDTSDANIAPVVEHAQAIGRALEAEQAHGAGNVAEALDLMRQAIALSAAPRERGTWWGFVSIWERQRCSDTAARDALQNSTEQYQLAVSTGRMKQETLDRFLDQAMTDLNRENKGCTNHESSPSQ